MTKINLPNSVVTLSSGTPISGQIPQFTGTGNTVTSIASPTASTYIVSASGDTTGATDVTMLNAALAAHVSVHGVAGSTYYINAPLKIPSNTTFDMTDCIIQQATGVQTLMVQNKGVTAVATATDTSTTSGTSIITSPTLAAVAVVGQSISVVGAGGAGSPFTGLISAVSTGTNQITVTFLDGTAVTTSTTVSGANATLFTRDNAPRLIGGYWNKGNNPSTSLNAHAIVFERCDNAYVQPQGVSSTGADNGHAVQFGDVSNAYALVKNVLFNGVGIQTVGPIMGLDIPELSGTTYDDMCAILCSDYSGHNDSSGNVKGVRIGIITGTSQHGNLCKFIAGSGNTIDGITVGTVTGITSVNGLWIGDDSGSPMTTGGSYGSMDIELVDCVGFSSSPVSLYSPAAERIRVRAVHRVSGSTRPMVAVVGSSTVTINELIIEGETSGIGTIAVQISNTGLTIYELTLNGLRHNPTVVGDEMLDVHHATLVQDIILNDCVCTANALVIEGALVSRIHVKDGTYNGTGMNFYQDTSGASVVMTLDGCSISGQRVAFVLATLTVVLTNALLGTFTSVPFYVSGGILTVQGSAYYTAGTTLLARAASEVLRCNGADLPVNVAILTPLTGDQCYNTTASGIVPTGKILYDGSRWRSLQTPASLASGIATLSSGASSVANSSITANSLVRLTNIGAGGTIGILSVALTAGTGFAVNSSSNTDASKVFWEVVQY